MKILIACEFSGIVREEFRKRGHDAWSCDFLPSDISGKHYQGDVMDIINDGWDMMIAFPVCTRLCNSGVQWLAKRNLWKDMKKAARFFKDLYNCNIPRVAIENPIPHKYALEIIGRKYSQIIQPWQFGHPETKAICLWIKMLPLLKPTNIVDGREQRIWKMPPSKDRGKLRSVSFPGIGQAMAEQWG